MTSYAKRLKEVVFQFNATIVFHDKNVNTVNKFEQAKIHLNGFSSVSDPVSYYYLFVRFVLFASVQ
jgi:hypothetical protein